jgi:hypothetical protein
MIEVIVYPAAAAGQWLAEFQGRVIAGPTANPFLEAARRLAADPGRDLGEPMVMRHRDSDHFALKSTLGDALAAWVEGRHRGAGAIAERLGLESEV